MKDYFQGRVGRKLPYPVEAIMPGQVARRDYEITISGISGDTLLINIAWSDLGRDGKKAFGGTTAPKVVKVKMRGLGKPADALEMAARTADPQFFVGHPPMKIADPNSEMNALDVNIAALLTPEGRGADEQEPLTGSIARLRAFMQSTPNILLPQIFSSKDGTIRARWNHGTEKTLWINFPVKGPLGWSVSLPRTGGYGMRKMNARCIEDIDILPMAELLGIVTHR
jgi:hypothetical protein